MVPDLADLLATSRVVSLPMTTRFRGITVREAVLIEGPFGWTEFSPFVEYDDEEATAWLRAAIDFGWRAAPEPLRDRIPVNATVPAVPADQVPAVLARFPGTRTAKVKVAERGQTLTDDVERVRAVRDALGAEGRVRVDANALWNLDEAEHAIHALAPFDLEYVEQPCATVDELAELRRRIRYMGIPIAADESVRKAADPLAVAKAGAADIVIVKAQPLGGVHAARRIVAEAGLPAVVSSALDTSVGIAMGAHLAAALPELEFDCGLGTVALFAQDVADEPLRPVDGSIPVVRPSVSSARLDELQADTERTQWWLDRLARCHRILERGLAL
ncbi:o-succinylbenzoate synthase [Leifsonia soli]|uniref:o-succinylbenzoate synthase n=1 Tax=Leifsonia soli TaxID=582665 RepID=A0A852T3Y5_9MICO|nr:o-succinylbenzoate synthase [Leifsonia soli]NYD75552.1 O-succinylbenzoate synthase [Leifsonia soli]